MASGLLGFESVLNRDYPVVFAHALHLLAGRPGGQPDLGPRLHLDRSADRFRDAGRSEVDDRSAPAPRRKPRPFAAGPRRCRRTSPAICACRRSTCAAGRISRPTGVATGRCGYSSSCSSSPLFAEFIANDKPFLVKYDGRSLLSRRLSAIRRRRSAAISKPRPTIAILSCGS